MSPKIPQRAPTAQLEGDRQSGRLRMTGTRWSGTILIWVRDIYGSGSGSRNPMALDVSRRQHAWLATELSSTMKEGTNFTTKTRIAKNYHPEPWTLAPEKNGDKLSSSAIGR